MEKMIWTPVPSQLEKLAEIYNQNHHDAYIVATICDEVLDRSGGLLGRVREVAREKRGW